MIVTPELLVVSSIHEAGHAVGGRTLPVRASRLVCRASAGGARMPSRLTADPKGSLEPAPRLTRRHASGPIRASRADRETRGARPEAPNQLAHSPRSSRTKRALRRAAVGAAGALVPSEVGAGAAAPRRQESPRAAGHPRPDPRPIACLLAVRDRSSHKRSARKARGRASEIVARGEARPASESGR